MIALEKRCGQKMASMVPDDYSRHIHWRRLRSSRSPGLDIYDQVIKSYGSFGSYSFYMPYIDTFGLHKQKKEEMPMRDIKKQKNRKRDTKGKRLFKELLIKMMGEKPIEKEV